LPHARYTRAHAICGRLQTNDSIGLLAHDVQDVDPQPVSA